MSEPLPRGSFLPAALWAMFAGALVQGLHLAIEDDGLSLFAAVANVGILAPLLVIGAVGLAWVANSATALGWIDANSERNTAALGAWGWSDDVDALRRRSAGLLAAGGALAVFAGVSYAIGRAILAAVARPQMGLALVIGSQLVVLVMAGGAFVVLSDLLGRLFRLTQRRALVAPASYVAAATAVGAIAALAVREATDVGAYLPWDLVTGLVAAVVAWVAARRIRHALASGMVATAALVGCFALTIEMPVAVRADRAVFTDVSPIASTIYRPLHALLDRDGDGSIDLYGGGDCAPDDPAIHPGAIERLNNGIDEDCSGADFTEEVTIDEAARSFGKPKEIHGRPNVVLITTDSLSFDRTSLGRDDRDTTPNLARWAKERGVVYDAAFTLGPSTRLAFPGIMASMFNSSVAMKHTRHHPYDWSTSTPTIARALAAAGYRTVMVAPDPYFTSRWKNGPSVGFQVRDDSPTRKPADRIHTSPEVTAATIAQLEKAHKAKAPTFLWVHYYDHHSPFRRPRGGEDYGKKLADVFDSEVQYADRSWGKLFDAIDRIFGDEEVVVIFTSDHGESFDRYHPKKHHGHDIRNPVMHVPLVIVAPGAKPHHVGGLATHADLAPTIADITGIARDPQWIGESLVPSIWQGRDPAKTVVYSLYYLPERFATKDEFAKLGVRTADWYFERNIVDDAERLTAWRKDPSGERDVLGSEPHTAELLRHLAAVKLAELRERERSLAHPAK